MIKYTRFTLDNGLKVILNADKTTPMVAMNVLYDVGARDEHPDKTGFAHLFEHLMFGGSVNIPSYDVPLQQAGGENNAFTSNDITNYYLTIPKQNVETAFWLESDRMLGLAFSQKNLDVQRNVVIEEYKQRYLNQPYGDLWLLLRPLAYKKHPYQWPTIGKDISHIEKTTLEDVKAFYEKYYHPANAILSISGNLSEKELRTLCNKWFAPIPSKKKPLRNLPKEPVQTEKRVLKVTRDVPFDVICMAYHMCSRTHEDYYATDLLSDILSGGNSSRLYLHLVKDKRIFSDIDAFITGDRDEGLFVFYGKLMKGISFEFAENAILNEIEELKNRKVKSNELQKVKNKYEASEKFSEVSIQNRALKLAIAELLGDAELVNTEILRYAEVTATQLQHVAQKIFQERNCSVLLYQSGKTSK